MADPSTAPSGSPMSKLSIEILLRITFWLKTPDLCNMRLTCHSIERCLYDSFVEEFIARKQFMITPFSLRALVTLTESPIGAHLRRLQIGTDVLEPGPPWPLTDASEGKRLISEQQICTRDGSHRRLLAQAFRNIKRHRGKNFDIVIRDFNSRRRTRDADMNRFAEWRSYGTIAAEEHGLRVAKSPHAVNNFDPSPCSLTAIFRDVLISLADADATASGIEVMARYGDFLSERAFLMNSLETGVPSVLSSLQKLHLTLGVSRSSLYWESSGESLANADDTDIMAYQTLPGLLAHCDSLRELRINQQNLNNMHMEAFLVWLSKRDSVTFLKLQPPLPLNNLETLSIGMTHTRPQTLYNVLVKYLPTLSSLELWRVTLCVPFPETSVADTPEPTLWRDLLVKLAGKDSKLKHIMIGNAAESYQTGEHVHLQSAVPRQITFSGTHMREYRGNDARNAFLEMSRSVKGQEGLEQFKRRLGLHVGFSASEDDDEDEDMDDDHDDDDDGDENDDDN